MNTLQRLVAACAILWGGPTPAEAAPIVAGFERYGRLADSDAARVDAGLVLVGELGCVNCHAASKEAAQHVLPKAGPVLAKVGVRLRPEWIVRHVKSPHEVKPGTTMPDVLAGLPAAERDRVADAIAHFLISTGEFVDGWGTAPPKVNVGAALAAYEQSGCAACHGSRKPDAAKLPDAMPLGDLAAKWSPKALHDFLRDPLDTRPSSRMPAAAVRGSDFHAIVAALIGASVGPDGVPLVPPPAAAFAVDPARATEGRTLFAAVGCANCHRMPADGKGTPIAATRTPKPLADLAAPPSGCLAPSPPAAAAPPVPWYGLDDAQRAAIMAALSWLNSPSAAAPAARERQIDRGFTALNCYACHARDGKGGTLPAVATVDEDGEPIRVDPARDALFTSAVAELGDEARLPPTLTGVGDKLTPEYLLQVLRDGVNERATYMHTAMPRWHGAVTDPLARLLADDPKTTVPLPALDGFSAADITEQGRILSGSKALGCIKCHQFDRDKGQSLGVLPMVRMAKRLRHEWFLAYVANPQHFRPGTRMPASWPDGKVFFPDILDGTAAGQIEGIWRYISSKEQRPPVGLAASPIELVPVERPIIYRNFISGAGPRAIGVGYPEKVNIAWDADALRLALVWKGAFIDAGLHWSGRGNGFQPPLGDGLFTADATTPLAAFAAESELATATWPKGSDRKARGPVADHRFKGYRLDAAGRPAFQWQWGDCVVVDSVEPATFSNLPGGTGPASGLKRTLTLSGSPPPGTVVFRGATGATLTAEPDGWHRIDGHWRVRVTGGGPAVRREEKGQTELRVPIVWKSQEGGRAEAVIVEELAW
jgi:mono/diheme cytochrome c family protein